MKRKIDLESLPLKDWKKEATMFQDDYTAGAGTSWLLNVAKAENKMIWEMIRVIEEAPTLTAPNEWVSVEERLPEVGQEVLVYWWNTSQKAEHFELTHYDGDHWFLLDNTERPWIVVVAWMPLPAPPDRRPPEGENHHG